jgi:transglutaminase-like putative cysteine protease
MVAEVLAPIVMTNASAERIDILRKGFEYCRDAFTYLRKDPYNVGDIGWEIEDAKEMFGTGLGNCYNYAAAFWAVARGLGYEARAISGTCTDTDQPHGWVGLYYEGTRYFVDPEWQYAYTEREVFDKDMFMLTMDEVWWWTYKWDNTQF